MTWVGFATWSCETCGHMADSAVDGARELSDGLI